MLSRIFLKPYYAIKRRCFQILIHRNSSHVRDSYRRWCWQVEYFRVLYFDSLVVPGEHHRFQPMLCFLFCFYGSSGSPMRGLRGPRGNLSLVSYHIQLIEPGHRISCTDPIRSSYRTPRFQFAAPPQKHGVPTRNPLLIQ